MLHEIVNLGFLHIDPIVVLKKAEPISLGPDVEPPMHGFLMVQRVMHPAFPLLDSLLPVLLDLIFDRSLQLSGQLR
jgi:hypothetical protein